MNRIMIIGCSGSGKSTLARKLQRITQLELIHLDQHFWQSGWVETDKETWRDTVRQLADKHSWIIDGNYGATMQFRIIRADTIIFLDFPTWKCLFRVWKRTIRYWNRHRPDITEGCNERISWTFYNYVLHYNQTRRPGILAKLDQVKGEKEVIILQNDREVNEYLKNI